MSRSGPTLAAEFGGVACGAPAQAAAQADCVFLCVGDSAMSEEALIGKNGVIEGAKPGTVVADASTVSPEMSRKVGRALAEKGVPFLDAPCTGSRPGAEGGTLTFMIGGDQKVYEKIRPYLEVMGKQFYYCGGPGMGLHAKLSQNLILANMLQAFNEGMVLCTKAGVDPAQMIEILNNSAAKSGFITFKAPYILNRDFSTNFSTKWMHKDVGLAIDSAEVLNLPLPVTAVTQQMFRAAIAMGFGEEDLCATIKVMEEWSGIEVKKSSS
jgi:3-hydroxyisobutyrate dehydrogenase/2-hydroxy-3-oxopropionate reductase